MCDIILDTCEVWRETKYTAYKQHRCACCRTPILAGAEYWRHFSIFDHEITSEALCLSCWSDREDFTRAHSELTPTPGAFWRMLLSCIEEDGAESKWATMRDNILARNRSQDMTTPTPTPLHCKVCAKPLHGQQRLYCGRPCKRRAYAAKQKLREAQELADVVDAHSCVNVTQTGDYITVIVPPGTIASTVNAAVAAHRNAPKPPQVWTSTTLTEALKAGSTQEKMELLKEAGILTAPTSPQSSLPRRLYACIQLLGHTLYHVFDGWRTK